jgi:hypothetical protein
MTRIVFAALIAAGLSLAPLQPLIVSASAQTTKTDTTSDDTQAKPTPAKKTKTTKAKTTKTKKPPSAAQQALRERQKKCGAEWKADKAAGKVEKGMKWPQYWSKCNKRLKAGG